MQNELLSWEDLRVLAECIVAAFCHKGVIRLAGDETVAEHLGKKVFGKGRHRGAKRPTHSCTAHLWGHKWVVLAILVDLPGTNRPWGVADPRRAAPQRKGQQDPGAPTQEADRPDAAIAACHAPLV
jgi:hypothetical protein